MQAIEQQRPLEGIASSYEWLYGQEEVRPFPINGVVPVLLVGVGLVGTGAMSTSGVASLQEGTGSVLPQASFAQLRAIRTQRRRTASGQVAHIRSVLGLSVTAIAAAMRVERPAVYDWLSGVLPREANQKRLADIYRVACRWEELSTLPASNNVKTPVLGSASLLDILTEQTIDINRAEDAMVALSDIINARQAENVQESLAKRLRSKGFKEHGADTAISRRILNSSVG